MDELEKINWKNKETSLYKLKEYIVWKWQWTFRVFMNLWLNYNKDTEAQIKQLQDVLTKSNWNNKPIWIKEWDRYVLDSDFNIRIYRDWNEILKFPLIKIEEKEETKKQIKEETNAKNKQHIMDSSEKLLESLVSNLDDDSKINYYMKLKEDENEEKWAENKIPKTNHKTKSKHEIKDTKPIKESSNNLIKKSIPNKTPWIKLSKEARRRIINHIERINPWFKEYLWHVYDIAREYRLHPALLIAVMQNDSTLWKHLYSKNNFWNVWNTDKVVAQGKKWVSFKSPRAWIKAVARNMRKRIDSFYIETKLKRSPTVEELLSWVSKNWIEFFWRYMTKENWPKKVSDYYKEIALN